MVDMFIEGRPRVLFTVEQRVQTIPGIRAHGPEVKLFTALSSLGSRIPQRGCHGAAATARAVDAAWLAG